MTSTQITPETPLPQLQSHSVSALFGLLRNILQFIPTSLERGGKALLEVRICERSLRQYLCFSQALLYSTENPLVSNMTGTKDFRFVVLGLGSGYAYKLCVFFHP